MIGLQVFRHIPTSLEINGPILSFSQQPVGVATTNTGSVTLVGIATAEFPTQTPANTAENTGYISYRWYEVGVGALSNSATVTGTATTALTLSNLISPTDNGRQFFLRADYIPSAYAIGKSTPNAINDSLDSNIVGITVYPLITITTQPSSATASQTKSTTFSVDATVSDGTNSNLTFQWELNGNVLADGSTVSGSSTKNLTISLPDVGVNTVRSIITHPTASNSPIYSNTVDFTVVSARQIINFESMGGTSTANLLSWNLFSQGEYVHTNPTSSFPILSFYAPEKDVDLILDIYASKGVDRGAYTGGQGGVSTIQFTARQNEEYVIAPLPQANQSGAVYIYRKSRLIAVVGSGGDAGTEGNGGDGGGVSIAGANGSGRNGGTGGILIPDGSLPPSGIFGSSASENPLSGTGDTKAAAPGGGRVLPCPRGGYWFNQGKAPCDDLGNIQFYLAGGTLVTNTATINRGFKSGYGIRQTSGAGISGGGNGGQGATGGNGGTNNSGGGGGSGYTDGSVRVLSTRLGGNAGNAKVVFRIP